MQSKLPHTGTTIFTIMSKMAAEHDAINLSQGFPDFEIAPELIDMVHHHMKAGRNQYPPMPGVPALREQIASKIEKLYARNTDPDSEITITTGATEGIYATITALVHPGDEVIIFEPAYDLYDPTIHLCGGKTVRIKMQFPDYQIPWDEVREKVNDKTRLIIINTPHNPTGTVLTSSDMQQLEGIVAASSAFVLCDEAYEHIVFDEAGHESMLKHPALTERGIAAFSFGKTFHATGWKMGYTVAPREVTEEIRRIHQWVNFTVNTPIQWAMADYLKDPDHYLEVSPMYKKKRDLFQQLTKGSNLRPLKCSGTYFQLMSYESISTLGDFDLASKLTKESGIASIPVSAFYDDKEDNKVLRFCFAKTDETLEKAAAIIREL
ncbi:MAG: methionine aminotransferase [Cyclobacteriaceae bacterium]